MKRQVTILLAFIVCLAFQPALVNAEPEVLIERGDGALTDEMLVGVLAKYPEGRQRSILANSDQLERFLDDLLLTVQLSEVAKKDGFADEPEIQALMEWAAIDALARAWVEHYMDNLPEADYEQLAREEWMRNKEDYKTKEAVDVSHILISTKTKSEEEARALAEGLYEQLVDDPARFDEMVQKYSEDPGRASNDGHYYGMEKGQLVRPFEQAAFSLPIGEISAPVKTVYGFHLVRVDARYPPRIKEFDEVREQIIRSVSAKRMELEKTAYIKSFNTLPASMSEDVLNDVLVRYLGEEAVRRSNQPEETARSE